MEETMQQAEPPGPPEAEFEAALVELAAAIKKKRSPTRYHARALLVTLGRMTLDAEDQEGEPPTAALIRRLQETVEPQQEGWEAAVRDELKLACSEHILGVDPRFLEHPRFDFEYVVAARERLEARLAAAEALDLMPGEDDLDRLAAADRQLAPYLERAADGSAKEPPPAS